MRDEIRKEIESYLGEHQVVNMMTKSIVVLFEDKIEETKVGCLEELEDEINHKDKLLAEKDARIKELEKHIESKLAQSIQLAIDNEYLKTENAQLIDKVVAMLDRIKLEFDVNVCECGEEWKETDCAILVNEYKQQILELKESE